MDEDSRQRILDNLEIHRNIVNQEKSDISNDKYNKEGKPVLVPYTKCWDCEAHDEQGGVCQFKCCDGIRLSSFYNVSELKILKWLINHKLMDVDCNMRNCSGGKCRPIALGDKVGLKCTKCLEVSKGGLRGFWSKGKLGPTRALSVVFAIVNGTSFPQYTDVFGFPLNKNTWTKTIKDVGLVVGEALERNRRNPDNKYKNAQIDETAFGKRKWEKGKRQRKGGVQWGLTIVEVDPVTKHTLAVDLQMLAFNKRDVSTIKPLVVQRMIQGGIVTTDSWKAYPQSVQAAGCEHRVVNHRKEFVDSETGAHTNNVEGIHHVLKDDAKAQFRRLPYLTGKGIYSSK